MTNNDHQSNAEKEPREAESSTISQRRRNLVKSAIVTAPIVLTLRSGAAAALASAEQCIAKDGQLAELKEPKSFLKGDKADMWVRKQTLCRKLKHKGKKNIPLQGEEEFWVYLVPMAPSSLGPVDPDSWLNIDNSAEKYIEKSSTIGGLKKQDDENENEEQQTIMVLKDTTNEFIVEEEKTCQVLVLYTENGRIAGYGHPSESQGNPITASCWASLNPILP